jgi:hypothetical protein
MEHNANNNPQVEIVEIDMEKINDFFKSLPAWGIERETGYKPISTFWQDFSIADAAARFGCDAIDAIRTTWKAAVTAFRSDYKMMTELVMVLNHKIWQHHNAAVRAKSEGLLNQRDHHMRLAEEYDAAWRATDEWCCKHFTGEAAEYYFETTD